MKIKNDADTYVCMKIKDNVDIDRLALLVDKIGFWKAINRFIYPDEVLDNKRELQKVKSAIRILRDFEYRMSL